MRTGMCFALALITGPAYLRAQPQSLIRNGGFEVDSDDDGIADDWKFQGDQGVKVTWSRDVGVEGKYSQKLECTSFRESSPASHVMLAQYDTLSLKEGQWYRLSFQAKGERIPGNTIDVAIQQTGPWENLGLSETFRVRPEWQPVEFSFQATKTISTNLRLQIWFAGTGTMGIDDVRLVEGEPVRVRYTERLADMGSKNLIPNSSFECGTSGWGSITSVPGWGGNMSSLFGEIVWTTAAQHGCSLKIALDRAAAPVYYFDYYEMLRQPVLNPLAANRGWITVQPGADYTLSAYVKADPADTPCALVVYQAFGGQLRQDAKAGADWVRVSFTFKPSAEQVFVGLGPDLAKTALPHATLWVDGVQLEKGAAATDYEPRAPVEIGVEWERFGHLFADAKAARARVTAFNATGEAKSLTVQATVTDFWDRSSPGVNLKLTVPAGEGAQIEPEFGVPGKGFYRVGLTSGDGVVIPTRAERFAVIEPCNDTDGLFGMNHAYPFAELNRLSKEIGLTWFRDWSLKWAHVEPERGRFEFADADNQIDRVLQEGLNVIGLLPFPSSEWSSTAPPELATKQYPGIRTRQAFMPRDLGEFADYVRATVRHYTGRIRVWEILNEPIYTDYALPRNQGYAPADYVRVLQTAYEAVKEVDPKAFVIGGIAAGPETLTPQLIEAGGLKWMDAINIHIYPGLTQPERYIAGFESLNEMMEKAGRPRPIWFTEGAYYADDDPPYEPYHSSWMKLVDSEMECAAYQVRFDAILLSYGARKIIYHSGTPGSLNDEELSGIFFEWEGAPRKMAVSQSVLTSLLGPDTRALGSMSEQIRAYAFYSRGRTVVVLWNDGFDRFTVTATGKARLLDIVGGEVEGRKTPITDTPCYVVLEGAVTAEQLRRTVAEAVRAARP